jgi:murein DD-endopeptidase MepM/ murein hydrolase activator NlpD
MKRALALAVAALALGAGSARGDTFAIVSSAAPATPASSRAAVLASADTPNPPGSLRLPPGWTDHASRPIELSSAQLRALWQSAGAAYGIPWPVLAAINKVESNFGRNMGPSSAGAVGWMQFMPSTWLRWGYDFDQDGYADPWNPTDAIYSAARYLAACGGQSDIESAIFSYNHAQWYVDEVLSLARLLSGDNSLAFELDAMQISLEKAERKVAALGTEIATTRTAWRKVAARYKRMAAAAERAPSIADRTARRLRAAQVGVKAQRLERRLADLGQQLKAAQKELARARERARAASFNSAAAPFLANARYGEGYVFPVGGGPSRVSVAHTHHDYPAADIAAPAGSPVYALTNGVVERAWRTIDPLCGIGLIYRADDGRRWAYCHLSYLEPSVRDGVRLPAGATIGLVGSTGHSTGPHLHLALKPELSYPQDEAWFQSFAGIAFRWQDAPTPTGLSGQAPSAATLPVFAVETSSPEPGSSAWSVSDSEPAPSKGAGSRADGGPRPIFAPAPGSDSSAGSGLGGGSDPSNGGSLIPFTN